jgi:hypothetical protein
MEHALRSPRVGRRGVLLLVVLSMLTLFMMLGTTYLVISTRARKTARAFADNVAAGTTSGLNAQRMLDEAMMAVARGTTGTSAIAPLRNGDDLLGDKYGANSTTSGTISGNATGSAIIALPTSLTGSTHLLAGRVITFTMPSLNDVSTRILRADSSGTLYVPGGQTAAGSALTASAINSAKQSALAPPHFIVNGREFDGGTGTNEPYDAVVTTGSASDPCLGRVMVVSGTPTAIASFATSISGTTIDNDGDGRPDSGWIDVGLPWITDLSGNGVKPKAAILVIDLDGRLNVNAHGSRTDLENTGSSTDCLNTGTNFYPTIVLSTSASSGTIPMQVLPRGMGAGVAEISLFGPLVPSAASTGLGEILGGSSRVSDPNEAAGSDSITKRPRPNLGDAEGRYGDSVFNPQNPSPLSSATPGKPNVDDNTPLDRWVSSSGSASYIRFFEDTSNRYGSPADLKGRMRVWTDAFGQPVYYKPYWGKSGGGNPNRGQVADDDVVDDSYEMNLGRSGPRTGAVRGSLSSPADNIYTPADLEAALRFFDPDTMRLSRRLMALCRENASAARTLVTTESWDTPAVTGTAWSTVVSSTAAFSSLLALSNAADFFSPETIMGHKLDLNRPFHDPMVTGSAASYSEPNDPDGTARRQQFAKQLYCLFIALYQANSGTTPSTIGAEQLAQWTVNIIDFRDDDSIMTPFDYDETFSRASPSWNPTRRVWGVERPEILITETLAWHDRRTDDHSPGGRVTDRTTPDNDFDQESRPRGAFFVELYSPWGSQAMQYSDTVTDGTVTDVTGTNGQPYRGEPLPAEFISGTTARFERTATINLARTHNSGSNAVISGTIPGMTLNISGTASPVWRLATVRGTGTVGNAFGPDLFVTGSSGSSGWIVDPSRAGTTAAVDRVFYFTTPSQANLAEKPGAVFWQSAPSTVEPSQTRYVVVGTNLLAFNYSLGTTAKADRCFDYPPFKHATISEPLVTTQTIRDGYDAVYGAIAGDPDETKGVFFGSYGVSLVTPIDQPADSEARTFDGISLPFLDASGQPILMQNGTHENFAVVHLQRLADPNKAWNATTNPYLTVDSMPVDLTVVNTANVQNFEINAIAGENYDEPNYPVKQYRYASTERGGKTTDNASPESDIWNRRVNATIQSLTKADAFRTASLPLTATGLPTLPPVTGGGPRQLQKRPVPTTSDMHTLVSGTPNATTAKPSRFSTTRFPWLFWANRPFTSAAELALVPTANAFRLPAMHTTATGTTAGTKPGQGSWGAGTRGFAHLSGLLDGGTQPPDPFKFVIGSSGTTPQPGILDFVHVPSRFTGSYMTISSTTPNASTIGLDQFPLGQISHFREPGRVNVNTLAMASVTSGTSWNPLFGTVVASSTTSSPPPFFGVTGTTTSGSAVQPPFTPPLWNLASPQNPFSASSTGTASGTATPAADLLTILNRIKSDSTDNTSNWPHELQAARDHGQDAFFRYDMAIRMSNLVTTRSNVFAIWVTIGYFDDSGQEIEPKRRNRAFYIFDRSIPVGYEAGKDHNARDAILLRRIIQ